MDRDKGVSRKYFSSSYQIFYPTLLFSPVAYFYFAKHLKIYIWFWWWFTDFYVTESKHSCSCVHLASSHGGVWALLTPARCCIHKQWWCKIATWGTLIRGIINAFRQCAVMRVIMCVLQVSTRHWNIPLKSRKVARKCVWKEMTWSWATQAHLWVNDWMCMIFPLGWPCNCTVYLFYLIPI